MLTEKLYRALTASCNSAKWLLGRRITIRLLLIFCLSCGFLWRVGTLAYELMLLRYSVSLDPVGQYTLRNTERYREVLNKLRRLTGKKEYDSFLASTYTLVAGTLSQRGMKDVAFYYLDSAIGLDSDNPRVYAQYGWVLAEQGNAPAAEHMLARAAYWQSWWDTSGRPVEGALDYNSSPIYREVAKVAFEHNAYDTAVRSYLAFKKLSSTALSKTDWKNRVDELIIEMVTELDVDVDEQAIILLEDAARDILQQAKSEKH